MSLLLAASPLADDGQVIAPQIVLEWLPEEVAEPDYYAAFEVILCAPLDDNAVTEDYYQQPVIFDGEADAVAADIDLQPDYWATPPPSQEDDYVRPFMADAEEPQEDGAETVISFPADSDDEYLIPFIADAPSEEEADADQWLQAPPDEPAAIVDDTIIAAFIADEALLDDETDDSFVLPPLEDAPVIADDGWYCTIWTEDGFEEVVDDPGDYEIQISFNNDDTTSTGVAYGWTTHFYSRRKRKKRKAEDVEEFYYTLETKALDDAPAPVVAQAEEARAAAQAYITAANNADRAKLAKALDEINKFYDVVREQLRKQREDEEDEELLLLSW